MLSIKSMKKEMKQRYEFKCPCPIIGCPNNNINVKFSWVHATDDKKMYVTSNAELICEKEHSASMLDWNYKCENHDYLQASKQGLLLSLVVIAQLQNIDPFWILDISDKISKQVRSNISYDEYRTRGFMN
jgi:hypothetical protein